VGEEIFGGEKKKLSPQKKYCSFVEVRQLALEVTTKEATQIFLRGG